MRDTPVAFFERNEDNLRSTKKYVYLLHSSGMILYRYESTYHSYLLEETSMYVCDVVFSHCFWFVHTIPAVSSSLVSFGTIGGLMAAGELVVDNDFSIITLTISTN